MEAPHPGEIIADQYQIKAVLGQGGIGTTYEAQDLHHHGQPVALKALSLRHMQDWKVLELFEREARVLSHLHHRGIPRYLNHFQVDTPDNRCFYLVQELATGQSLAALVERGWHGNEAEIRHLATQVLEILIYLHGLAPPVIHRDIKPENLIRRQDGQIYLVDFGSVKDTYRDTLLRSGTVVGTYGYMAPEQFRGQAVPATDLYGLGTTLLFLLTGQSPAELPQQRLKLDFRAQVHTSPSLTNWLERMVEPVVEDRFASAREALSALRGEQTAPQTLAKHRRQPGGSRIKLTRTPQRLSVEVPPLGFQSQTLPLLGFTLVWNGFIFFWTSGAISAGAPIFFPLFSIPFWIIGIRMLAGVLFSLAGHTHLEMNRQRFQIQRCLWGFSRKIQGQTSEIDQVKLKTSYTQNHQKMTAFVIAGVRTHQFGSNMTRSEQEWLVQELSNFLGNAE